MPYDWLKQIPTALLQLDEIPLIGFPPPFPWEELSKGLSENFQIPDFKLEPTIFQWRTKEELFDGMGDHLSPLNCVIPSLEGSLIWLMAEEDVQRLMSLLLNDDHHELDALENEFLKGFYYFSAYEVIHFLTKLPFAKDLSFQIQKETTLPNEASLCMDIKIRLRGKTLTGRVIISSSLRRAWKEKYAERTLDIPLSSMLAEKLTIPVHIEAGRTSIKPSEWKSVRPGDFVLLDSCTVNPHNDKGGRVTLTVNGMPFYIGKIKDGNIKILDHPLYHQEEEIVMDTNSHDDTGEHKDSEFDFDSGFEDSEFESEEESESEEHEEELHHLAEDEHHEISKAETTPKENAETGPVVPSETSLKIDEIPLSVIIEIGRLQMSVKKILELQPGNLLELDVHPENGVDLVVNGKRIAKGELVRLGEALGVRILDIR